MSKESAYEDYVSGALERARTMARRHGYSRSRMPSWGLEEKRPTPSMDGMSEYAAIEVEAAHRESNNQETLHRAAVRAEAYGHETIASSYSETDPDGDLKALREAVSSMSASWQKSPGMAAMRPRYRSVNSLGAALSKMIRARQWDTPTKIGSVIAKWPAIVGPFNAEHTKVETFDGHKLIVRVDSTALAKQLQLHLPNLERRIDEEVGVGVVEQVILLGPVAPSWKKGPLRVKGRGPREDYG